MDGGGTPEVYCSMTMVHLGIHIKWRGLKFLAQVLAGCGGISYEGKHNIAVFHWPRG